jgi:hypothetical protein
VKGLVYGPGKDKLLLLLSRSRVYGIALTHYDGPAK